MSSRVRLSWSSFLSAPPNLVLKPRGRLLSESFLQNPSRPAVWETMSSDLGEQLTVIGINFGNSYASIAVITKVKLGRVSVGCV